jgi:hypothetical protein
MLLLAVVGALASVSAAVAVRLSVDLESRRADDRRLQALWLGRSGVTLGKVGTFEVRLGPDVAQVTTAAATEKDGKRVTATVVFDRYGTAVVEALYGKAGAPLTWTERYDRASQ